MENYNKYIGKIFDGRYRIERVLGLGGMAVVFMATDLSYGRKVAVKMLREDMAQDPTNVKRFENESKAVVLLEHDNIVKIYDVNVDGDLKYFVMEYLEGITLKEYIKQKGRLDSEEAISCAEQILKALQHAHSKGVIHRDIKPQNVMLLKNGQIKVTDFGIAKLPSAETVTMEDKAIGTVYYISPEQASGKKVDSRTDIYSLGALLYELVTGVVPFDGDNSVSIALKHIKEDPIPPRELDKTIPEGLDQLVTKAMKRPLEERFQTAGEMLALTLKLKKNPKSNLRLKKKVGHTKTTERGGTAMFPIILGATCAFFIALAITAIYLINIFFVNTENKPEDFKVANYVSLPYSEALEDELEKLFTRVNIEHEYSDEQESGRVIKQSVAPGLIRKVLSSDITLTVSMGREQMKMPDLEYKSLTDAISEINNLNFDLKIKQEKQKHDYIDKGYIISTTPAKDTVISKGDTVTLVVSDGATIEYVKVPDLVFNTDGERRTEEEATKLLLQNGLKLGEVKRIQSSEHPEGVVIEQSPKAGTSVAAGVTKVDLIISGGLFGEVVGDTMYMLDLKEYSYNDAVVKLNEYNFYFDISAERVPSKDYPEGIVVGSDPAPGTPLQKRAKITLLVSAGPPEIVTMPDLTGKTEDEARQLLKAMMLYIGVKESDYSDTVDLDKICGQSVAAGAQIEQGTTINITISLGPPEEETEEEEEEYDPSLDDSDDQV